MERQKRACHPNSSEDLIAERAVAATQIEELDKAMEEEDQQVMETWREMQMEEAYRKQKEKHDLRERNRQARRVARLADWAQWAQDKEEEEQKNAKRQRQKAEADWADWQNQRLRSLEASRFKDREN